MSKQVRDMTTGSPIRLTITFALPIMLGNIFQQMYTMTDTAILGQFAGVEALSALGSADWLSWVIYGVIGGVMQGFCIPAAQRFGAGDLNGLKRCVRTMLVLAACVAAFFTIAGTALAEPLLKLIRTRPELLRAAATYLWILAGGAVLTTAYNLLAGLLRAVGNSRVPLYAMVASSVTNIALDLLFIRGFSWGVAGAAAATVIAQGVAAAICLFQVLAIPELKPERVPPTGGNLKAERSDAGLLLRLAAPMAFAQAMISFGGLIVQSEINTLGFAYVAGFTATNKLYGLMEMAAVSFGFAITTFTGQNLGAGKLDRIRSGMRSFTVIGVCIALIMSAILFVIGRACLSLFIETGAAPEVMETALRYLKTMAAALFVLYLLYVFRSALQGAGDTVMPMVSGIAEFVGRTGCAILLTRLIGTGAIYWAESVAWLFAVCILLPAWLRKEKHLEERQYGAAAQ